MRSFNLVCTVFGVNFCGNGGEAEGRWSGKGQGQSTFEGTRLQQLTELMVCPKPVEDTSNTQLKLGCWFVCSKKSAHW